MEETTKLKQSESLRLFYKKREEMYKIINLLDKAANLDVGSERKTFDIDLRSCYDKATPNVFCYYYKNICILRWNSAFHIIDYEHENLLMYYKEIKKKIITKWCELFGEFDARMQFELSEIELNLIKNNQIKDY